MDNAERDQDIAKLYAGGPTTAGLSASKLATKFGISVPQVRRILASQEVKRHPDAPKPTNEDKVIHTSHLKIGNRLYAFRFQKLNDVVQGAEALGWSVRKLRSIEQGFSEITLSDLQDMSEYMNLSISEITGNL